jgi:hypothetical protein
MTFRRTLPLLLLLLATARCHTEPQDSDAGLDAATHAEGGCPGPNPNFCQRGSAGGPCQGLSLPATCQDGSWVCTMYLGAPVIAEGECGCFPGRIELGESCRCEGGRPVCTGPDAGVDATTDGRDGSGDATSACPACAPDELCVVYYDGTCPAHPTCKKKTANCQAPVCDDACNRELCGTSTCRAAACPTTPLYPNALHCYGP